MDQSVPATTTIYQNNLAVSQNESKSSYADTAKKRVYTDKIKPRTPTQQPASELNKQVIENALQIANKNANTEPSRNRNNEGFREVRKRRRQPKIGSGDGDDNFPGRNDKPDKKIWLFISKVSDSITEDNIKHYIETRTNTNNVYIKKLPTDNAGKNNQSFMVGVDPQLQVEVYEPSFWPKKVRFDRFNFRLGRRFLDNASGDSQQDSFLVQ